MQKFPWHWSEHQKCCQLMWSNWSPKAEVTTCVSPSPGFFHNMFLAGKKTLLSLLESVSLYCSRPGWQPENNCLQRIMGNALLINYNGNLVMVNSGLGIAFPSVRCYPFKEKNICKVISLMVSTYSKWTIFVLPQMVLCWITQLTRFHKSFSKFSLIAVQYYFVTINPGK